MSRFDFDPEVTTRRILRSMSASHIAAYRDQMAQQLDTAQRSLALIDSVLQETKRETGRPNRIPHTVGTL